MDRNALTATWIKQKLVALKGTEDSFSDDAGPDYYVQAAADGPLVLVEISTDEYAPSGRKLPAGSADAMVALGFNRPTHSRPNWWILIEDGGDEEFADAARAVLTALTRVYGLSIGEICSGMRLPTRRSDSNAQVRPSQTSRATTMIGTINIDKLNNWLEAKPFDWDGDEHVERFAADDIVWRNSEVWTVSKDLYQITCDTTVGVIEVEWPHHNVLDTLYMATFPR